MKELSRTELATVKRTAANVKTFRAKKAKLEAQKAKIDAELESVNKSIDLFEQPIIEVTGGYTSEQVLNGEMDAALQQLKVAEQPIEEVATETASVATETPVDAPANPFMPTEEAGTDVNPLPFEA